jgi:D-alanyl-lipoteichoic acid acyltransferase DltB (MBOAT superfamily)
MSIGLYIFFIGLCKRVVIADTFGIYADYGFSSPGLLTFLEGWITSLSYTFQIYFDFSGYTDMAIGSAYFFNIKLPVNFNSPYLSLNIRDFWRRWHITLSAFLRDHIYIPLGGSRHGDIITGINILVTFLIAGAWHGTGWTFLVWGGLHGSALVINRFWQQLNIRINKKIALSVTFLFINATWVFFRADDIDSAFRILKAMMGLNGLQGILVFGSVEFLDKVVGLMIALISIAIVFTAKNTNAMPSLIRPSKKQLALTVSVILLGLFFLNSVPPKGFLYSDF